MTKKTESAVAKFPYKIQKYVLHVHSSGITREKWSQLGYFWAFRML